MNYERILLESIERISILEEEVKKLKEQVDKEHNTMLEDSELISNGKDSTKFMLDGKVYGKNRLVLAVVKKYMKMYPDTTAKQLVDIFDKSLQGSFGTVRTLEDAKDRYTYYEKRFFTNKKDIITTKTRPCVVCTQWSISNIGNIIARAQQLGIEIQTVK